MLNPMDIEKIQGDNSRYAVVMAIAKRAREISDDMSYAEQTQTEKAVSLAIEDFLDKKYVIESN